MTLEEAAQLVIQSSSLAKCGETFLLDMGKQVKIYDLAKQMILLSGNIVKDPKNKYSGGIEILVTGLKKGEKLFEELIINSKSEKTIHPLIFYVKEKYIIFEELQENILQLNSKINKFEKKAVFEILKKLVPEWEKI